MTPKGWDSRSIGEFTTQVSERARSRVLPVLSVSKDLGIVLQSEKFKKRIASDDTSNYKRVLRGQFVYDPMLLWAGNIGRQLRVAEGLVSPAYTIFECSQEMDATFLEYFFRRPAMLEAYRAISRGTNVRRQKALYSDFAALRFPFPPLAEQCRIAAILSSVDDAIVATQRVIDQLGVVKQAMMAELLTRGIPGRHTKFEKTEFGEVPEGWRYLALEALIERCDYGISSALSTDRNGVPVLRMGNLSDGEVDYSDLKYVPESSLTDRSLLLEDRDILFNRTNSLALVGKVGFFRSIGRPVTFASYLLRLHTRNRVADSAWLCHLLSASANQARLRAMATPGVSQANINRSKLLSLKVPVPPAVEQLEIANAIDTVNVRLLGERRYAESLGGLKSALLSALLTGEVRVSADGAVS